MTGRQTNMYLLASCDLHGTTLGRRRRYLRRPACSSAQLAPAAACARAPSFNFDPITTGTAQAQGSFPNFVAALSQPNFSSLKQVVTSLNLVSTFSNPALKVTVFVPTNGVSGRVRLHPTTRLHVGTCGCLQGCSWPQADMLMQHI